MLVLLEEIWTLLKLIDSAMDMQIQLWEADSGNCRWTSDAFLHLRELQMEFCRDLFKFICITG